MAVRGPQQPGAGPVSPTTPRPGPPLSPLEQGLLAAGLAKTPAEARLLAKSLVLALKGAGFPAAKPGDIASQLKAFQRSHGLPETGLLDDKTKAKLAEKGLLPGGAAPAKADAKPEPSLAPKAWGTFANAGQRAQAPRAGVMPAGERHHVVSHEQTRARAELARDNGPRDMRTLLDSLATLGFLGGGRGKERLEGALKGLQQAAGLPTSGKLDAATVRELVTRGALPEGSEAAALRTSLASPGSENREGARAQQGNAPAEGKGEEAGARGQGGDGVPDGARADGGAVRKGELDGMDERDTNAPAGDEDLEDERRGHASLDDDDSERDEGYWEVPPLSQQLGAALERLGRDDDKGGAATYSWDVTFYRPGVYGRRQPAEPLWHLVVDRANAFDPVWREAHEAITSRMRQAEPEVEPPTFDDFILALRRARVRGS